MCTCIIWVFSCVVLKFKKRTVLQDKDWLISHGRKYRWLICYERKTLLNDWQIRLISSKLLISDKSVRFCRGYTLIRLVSMWILWHSFQNACILETVQKNFILVKLSLLLWNYLISLHQYNVMLTYLMPIKLLYWDWPN